MIVQTFTQRRGEVVKVSPPDTPPEAQRVYVRILTRLPLSRRPVPIVVAYHPSDVVEVRS